MKLTETLSKIALWREIPIETRRAIRKDLDIKQSTSVEVVNNQVVNDGITEEGLQDIEKSFLIKVLKEGKYQKDEEIKKENIKSDTEEPVQRDNKRRYFKDSEERDSEVKEPDNTIGEKE